MEAAPGKKDAVEVSQHSLQYKMTLYYFQAMQAKMLMTYCF